MGDNLASIAIEEMMTIVIEKIRARQTELDEEGVKIWDDQTREVNTRHVESDRVSEHAAALEQLADLLEPA